MQNDEPRCYAKRLMYPYSGAVQIVEIDSARALSLDGNTWEIQCLHAVPGNLWRHTGATASDQKYARIAQIRRFADGDSVPQNRPGLTVEKEFIVKYYPHAYSLDQSLIQSRLDTLLTLLPTLKLPLPLADSYEYWLLDKQEQRPLALITSCCTRDEFAQVPADLDCWSAIPQAQINIPKTEDEQNQGLPPVSYQLEQLVRERAGLYPVLNWYKRDHNARGVLMDNGIETAQRLDSEYFPEFLIREDWSDPADAAICQRYLARISPRLLILQNLSRKARDKAEKEAKQYALDVERLFRLYPEIADSKRMTAIRVEARLRRSLDNRNNAE